MGQKGKRAKLKIIRAMLGQNGPKKGKHGQTFISAVPGGQMPPPDARGPKRSELLFSDASAAARRFYTNIKCSKRGITYKMIRKC